MLMFNAELGKLYFEAVKNDLVNLEKGDNRKVKLAL